MATAHIRCGDDLRARLQAAGWDGPYLPLTDPVCVGPVDEPGLMDYLGQRARFIALHAGVDAQAARLRLGQEYAALHGLVRHERVLLWFEHDWWDQAALMRVLSLLAAQPALEGRLFRMPADGVRPFVALGDAELGALQPVAVLPAAIEAGAEAWDAFAAADPTALDALSRRALPWPHLATGLRRHLMDLPWREDGLALTERQVLHAVQAGATTPAAALAAQHAADATFPVTDLILRDIHRRLSQGPRALLTPTEPWRLTERAAAVLAGTTRHRPAPRFQGGVAVGPEPGWLWDGRAAGVLSAAPQRMP